MSILPFPQDWGNGKIKRGAGYILQGVWGCPPVFKVPQDWGI
jgi:hypothetical protein